MLHIFLSNYPGDVKYGTTGKPVPGYDIRLVDDDGDVIKTKGEMGELQVRGPTSAIMYWNNREKSRDTFLGEWTRSGDKYVEDEDGYYVYCGRRDDMLKVGGIYVSPFEVEGALCTHPDVLEAAVVGWPDEDALIKPKAFVVLKSADKAGDELARALQEHVKSEARALQVSALDRVSHRAAQDRDRQDPALQAAGGRARSGAFVGHLTAVQFGAVLLRAACARSIVAGDVRLARLRKARHSRDMRAACGRRRQCEKLPSDGPGSKSPSSRSAAASPAAF